MAPDKIPPADERHYPNAAEQAHVLVNASLILRDLGLPKPSALFLFQNGPVVVQFIEAVAALRENEVEDHVIEGLIYSVWGRE